MVSFKGAHFVIDIVTHEPSEPSTLEKLHGIGEE
jgi:hypothetical protein